MGRVGHEHTSGSLVCLVAGVVGRCNLTIWKAERRMTDVVTKLYDRIYRLHEHIDEKQFQAAHT